MMKRTAETEKGGVCVTRYLATLKAELQISAKMMPIAKTCHAATGGSL